jgi:hypothetical protein
VKGIKFLLSQKVLSLLLLNHIKKKLLKRLNQQYQLLLLSFPLSGGKLLSTPLLFLSHLRL